ncbi:MAG: F0F1 ATP synthase subunit epsilon [Fimbriimonadaceae bacterium]
MPRPFQLSVVSPERTVFDDQVTSVIAPGVEGYLGVMAGHEPQIVALKAGLVEYEDKNGQRTFVATMGGFMEISSERAIILAEDAEISTEISIEKAEAELDKARRALRGEEVDMTPEQATEALNRAMVRLKAARMR